MRFRGGDLQGERGWQNKVKRSAKYQVCCLMLIFALFQNFCIAVALWENFWLWLWKYCCYCFRSALWEFSWSQTTLPAIFSSQQIHCGKAVGTKLFSMFQWYYINLNEKKTLDLLGICTSGFFLFYLGMLTVHWYYFHFSIFTWTYCEINHK